MADIGTATVRVTPNMQGIQGKIAAGFKGSAGPATQALGDEVDKNSGPFQNALGKLGGFAKGAGVAIAGGMLAGAAGLAALTTKAVMSAAELEQQLGGSEAVFGQYASTLQETAKSAYKNAGLSQQEFLQGANKMGSLFQGAGFSVQQSMTMSSDSMQRASDIASIMGISTTDALEAVTGMAKGNFTMMDNLGVAMNDTAIGAYAMSKGINKSTAEMSIQEKVGLAQQMFMEKTAKYAGNYAKENETLSGSLNTTKKAFDNLLAGQGDIGAFVDSLVNTIQIAVPQIVAMLPKIVEGIGATLKALVPALAKALPVLVPALITAVQDLLNALITALPTVFQTLVAALPMLIKAFVQLFLALLQALPQIIAIIAAAIPEIVNAIVTSLTDPASLQAIIMGMVQLMMALITAIPIIVNALVAALPVIIKNILAVLTNPAFIAQMIAAGVQLLKAVISGLVSMTGSVIGAAWDIIKAIGNVLKPSNLISLGTDVVKGLWQGIQDMGGWLKDKIIGFVKDKIPGPIKSALGIHSPSKVAALLGRQVPAGLAQGIDATSDMVSKAATNMANNAIVGMTDPLYDPSVAFGGLSGIGAGGGGMSTNNRNQTVTIGTVVLGDSSAVQEFYKGLDRDTINVGMGMTPIQGAQPA
jgi:phage-related protein